MWDPLHSPSGDLEGVGGGRRALFHWESLGRGEWVGGVGTWQKGLACQSLHIPRQLPPPTCGPLGRAVLLPQPNSEGQAGAQRGQPQAPTNPRGHQCPCLSFSLFAPLSFSLRHLTKGVCVLGGG